MPDNNTELAIIQQETTLVDYANERKKLQAVIKKAFKQGIDYGVIPGTQKQSLFAPGAEKIAKLFGLTPNYDLLKEVEDFDKGFFYYKYKCTLTHFATGKFVGASERSCNSNEKKYKSSYDKPGLVNTIQAMAQKRAFVAAVRVATGAAEIFGEDDIEVDGDTNVPKKPAKVVEDPEKANTMKRLHVVAAERGFSHEKISAGAKQRYSVDSLSECSLEQLTDLIDELEMKWDQVAEGEKPRKIGSAQQVIDPETGTVEGEVVEPPAGIAETVNCYQCGIPGAPTDGPHAYYCSEECKQKYWAGKGKPKAPNDWTFSANKGTNAKKH